MGRTQWGVVVFYFGVAMQSIRCSSFLYKVDLELRHFTRVHGYVRMHTCDINAVTNFVHVQ